MFTIMPLDEGSREVEADGSRCGDDGARNEEIAISTYMMTIETSSDDDTYVAYSFLDMY